MSAYQGPDDPLAQGYGPDYFYGPVRPNNVSSQALENVHTVKIGDVLLFGFTVYNNKNAAQFIQVFDLPTAPGAGAVPVVVFSVATVAHLAINWVPPRVFRSGCFIANSSTAATLTAGSADCFFDVQFL